ncbi:caspase family protein [Aeromonas caviae]|uniref:Caspase family protein n=2 Tax=Aeromonas caviae TaxID=648 RepID=A0AAJ5Z9R5_AERCA|nr:caspase family protein [Aeromonas caviae]WFF97502.1 caspase family protein [Aeromonas caviae]
MNEQEQQMRAVVGSFSSGHALVIAVASYPKVSPLPASVINDGCDMHATLTSPAHCGFNTTNVALLVDSNATLSAIRRELEALVQRAKPDDTVVIFFSGHGARLGDAADAASALIPFDCDPDNFSGSILPEAEFSSVLHRIQAKRIVVFIDACHSGATTSFKSLNSNPTTLGYSEKSLARLAEGTGRVLIASSRASEFSLVFGGARNSLFTEHLLNALRGGARTSGDGLIRVFEIFNHVAEQVRAAAPGQQHPIFKASNLEDNFPVTLESGGVKTLTSIARLNGDRELWRQLEDIFCDLYPAGPQDQDIWLRAGGEVSRLRLTGSGRANWFAALRTMRQGGGGVGISQTSLIEEALREFPHHQELIKLKG